jgi:WD40 repeat protein
MEPKSSSHRLFCRVIAVALFSLPCFVAAQTSAAKPSATQPVGPGNVVVSTKFGGQIFGFDVDQNGTEGILADVRLFNNGDVLSAVETFDLKTGKILNVLSKETNGDNDIVIGIVGTSTAITEREIVGANQFVDWRPYLLVSPLDANQFTAQWKPPQFDKNDIVIGVSRNQGNPIAAFLVQDNIYPGFNNFVFGTDVALNTFGPEIVMTDPNFEPYLYPAFALDTKTNTAVLAQDAGCQYCTPDIGMVNLTTGEFSQFTGFGQGTVNGLAVDSEDGTACTTTAMDGNVQFYDLKTQTGFTVFLPGASGRLQSGADVEFDPIHKLFLVGQPVSSTGQGSSIQVYDHKGNFVESVNGLSSPFTYIALLPKLRGGFVNSTPGLRSFTY